MTNEERYRTLEERLDAFNRYCGNRNCRYCQVHKTPHDPDGRVDCAIRWLAIEAEEKPLPCPFCGSEAEVVSTYPLSDKGVYVRCKECGAFIAAFCTEADAVAAWNRRVK